MSKSKRHTPEQIASTLKQQEGAMKLAKAWRQGAVLFAAQSDRR